MNGADFETAVRRHVWSVLQPHGFQITTHISGRMYSVEFGSDTHVVSMSHRWPNFQWTNQMTGGVDASS